jgi:NAD(P)-dependent dehydrogenase (short-subunit alcohol dehydrogenase family)
MRPETNGILNGKVVIVTGAGHGVGRGYAVAMAAAGAKVVVNNHLGRSRYTGQPPAADEVVDLIRKQSGEATANYADVTDMDEAGAMIHQAVDTYGHLDALVNNAGTLRDKMIFSMTESDWDDVMRVNLKGHFAPIHHAAAYWRARAKELAGPLRASIICTGSLVGLVGNVGQANYAASRGGTQMLAIALAEELERYGVRANCIAPSGATNLTNALKLRDGIDERVPEPEDYEEFSPRNPGNAAPLAVWLASDLSLHVNGQMFMSRGCTVSHFQPWAQDFSITVPGGNRKWDPEELGRALNTELFGSRHPGLQGFRTKYPSPL